MYSDLLKKMLLTGTGVFFIAVAVTFFSQTLISRLGLLPAVFVLVLILMTSIFADLVGTATLAASLPPFNSMAANRVPGAKEAIRIVQNADAVATFFNDIMGDVLGTISGGLAANIVFRMAQVHPELPEAILSTVAIGLVAAFNVGGKAAWKSFAIDNSTVIVLLVGKIAHFLEGVLRIRIFGK